MVVSCSSGSHESTIFTVELGILRPPIKSLSAGWWFTTTWKYSSIADNSATPHCHSWPFSWLVTSPVKALWIMTLLPPPQGAQWFPGVYSLVFWPILPSADPFLPCGQKRRYQLTCMHRGSNNEAFFSTSLKCAELSPSGKCALQCKKWSSSSVCSALLLCSSTLVPCTGVLWVQKSRSPLLRAQSCQRFSL